MKLIRYWNIGVVEEFVIYKLKFIEKIRFIFTGRISVIPNLLKPEDDRSIAKTYKTDHDYKL